MSDVGFIPTTRQVREAYEVAHEEVGVPCDIAGFDRWLNDIIRQAKAEALADAADEIEAEYDRRGVVAVDAQYQYNSGVLDGLDIAERVVRARADHIEQGGQP